MEKEKLDTILKYYQTENLNLIPTPPNHKAHFVWRHWQTKRQTLIDILQLCATHPTYTNIAAVTGFNNHLVIDCDQPGQFLEFIKVAPTNTLIVKTGRGYHIHYKTAEPLPQAHLTHILGVEVWGYGHFAQLPGSTHKHGSIYETLIDLPILEIPSIATIGAFMPRKEEIASPHNAPPFFFPRRKGASTSICDKIKSQIDIRRLLGDCCFSKSGQYHALGFCPFHNDENKSLSLHLRSNRVKCHASSCQLSNRWHSVIDIYMITHNVDQQTAINALAMEVAN